MRTELVTILLVDDDKVDVAAVTRALKERRIATPLVMTKDGIEGVDLLRATNGSARLLDADRIKAQDKNISGYVLKMQARKSFTQAMAVIEHCWKIIEFPVP